MSSSYHIWWYMRAALLHCLEILLKTFHILLRFRIQPVMSSQKFLLLTGNWYIKYKIPSRSILNRIRVLEQNYESESFAAPHFKELRMVDTKFARTQWQGLFQQMLSNSGRKFYLTKQKVRTTKISQLKCTNTWNFNDMHWLSFSTWMSEQVVDSWTTPKLWESFWFSEEKTGWRQIRQKIIGPQWRRITKVIVKKDKNKFSFSCFFLGQRFREENNLERAMK